MNTRWKTVSSIAFSVIFMILILGLRVQDITGNKLIVGRDTTFVLGPILPDGTIDFNAALNSRYSKGITPQENAMVILDQAFPSENESFVSEIRYHRLLGSPIPFRKRCIVSEEDFAKQKWGSLQVNRDAHTRFSDQTSQSQERSWSRAEFPDVAAWIDTNEKPLELIEQASHRSKFYDPFVSDDGPYQTRGTTLSNLRIASRLLTIRAMLRISEGQIANAMNDLLTVHRLSRLAGRNPTSLGALIAFAIESSSISGDQALISANLTAAQARAFLASLQLLPELPDIVETFDFCERLAALSALQQESRLRLDLNVIMRRTNLFFDARVKALQLPGLADRRKALSDLEVEHKARFNKSKTISNLFLGIVVNGRTKAISERVCDMMLGLKESEFANTQNAKDRAATRFELLKIGVALAAYRADKGEYPTDLHALTPDYLQEIPLDPFIEKPLRYRRMPGSTTEGPGFLLYSVGENGIDDGRIVSDKGLSKDLIFKVTHK